MNQELTLTEVAQNPALVASTATLRSGESVLFRPIQKDDAQRLGRYFTGLSQDTINRFGPHVFSEEMAEELCNRIGHEMTLRLVVLSGNQDSEGSGGDDGGEIIGYFLLDFAVGESDVDRYQSYGIALDPATTCKFAPSVADRYQETGVGSIVFPKCADIARRLGRDRMILMGGVFVTNARAIHYYEKNGFRKVGAFQTGTPKESFDMMTE